MESHFPSAISALYLSFLLLRSMHLWITRRITGLCIFFVASILIAGTLVKVGLVAEVKSSIQQITKLGHLN